MSEPPKVAAVYRIHRTVENETVEANAESANANANASAGTGELGERVAKVEAHVEHLKEQFKQTDATTDTLREHQARYAGERKVVVAIAKIAGGIIISTAAIGTAVQWLRHKGGTGENGNETAASVASAASAKGQAPPVVEPIIRAPVVPVVVPVIAPPSPPVTPPLLLRQVFNVEYGNPVPIGAVPGNTWGEKLLAVKRISFPLHQVPKIYLQDGKLVIGHGPASRKEAGDEYRPEEDLASVACSGAKYPAFIAYNGPDHLAVGCREPYPPRHLRRSARLANDRSLEHSASLDQE